MTDGPVGAAPVPSDDFRRDYETLRSAVALVPVGRDLVRVTGPDSVEYLQGQCSQDVVALAVGDSADALLLSPQGKLDALVRVTRAGDEDFFVDVDAGYGPAVVTRLARFKLRVKAEISFLDWPSLSMRGPATLTGSDDVAPAAALTVRYSWGGVDGIDLFSPLPVLHEGLGLSSEAAWQSVRVEAGIPLMGAELDERTIAAEADLLDRCVSFTKGCYTGQELVARLDARGNKVARRLRGLVVEAGAPSTSVVTGAEVVVGDKAVGRLTSVAWSGCLDTTVALAYLHRDVEPPCAVGIRTPAGVVVPAEARLLPLV